MLNLTSPIALLALFAALSTALPAPHTSAGVERREPVPDDKAGVYLCEDVGWGGACAHDFVPLGSGPASCVAMDSKTSSVGPDEGSWCVFYTNAFCQPLASDGSDALTLHHPGSANLIQTDKGNLNDRLLSYHCFKESS
ncbi:hypothetical protein C7974DRAFT_401019 [Boeremia exigua]|uniref:uncharacterized protein n=1 Tax=Boeremia exigua TaxID=749465 RepID=UPI001E8E6048|nr:uncharacterized protein C7974DRAFT_401019 [Boeremia exigua]KAH6618856.1 hypothetical protein C7974DRAFT_401019 [Boeremia exigua]